MNRRSWSRASVEEEIRLAAATVGGRMPTAKELQRAGRNDLACAIVRFGGFRQWATDLGLALSGAETHVGQGEEERTAEYLRGEGFTVERQTCKAPFDLLVDGVRVDVKAARPTMLRTTRAHVFALNKVPPTCDFYIMVGLDEDGAVLWRCFVPAMAAQKRTISVCGSGKYEVFKGALGELRRLTEERKAA